MSEETKKYYFYALTIEGNPETIRYIGVTSTSIKQRFRQHKYCAMHPEKCGLPVHKWMKSVYDSGKSVVPIELKFCNESEWEETEINLIQEYKNKGFKLLNLDKGGKGVVTIEQRTKSSLERSGEAHHKAVVAYTLDGVFVKEYKSITEAVSNIGRKGVTNICNVLKGRTKSAYGYIWKYKEDNLEVLKYSIDRNGKTIYRFDLNGNLIKTYEAIIDIVKELNGSYNGVKSAIINKKIYKDSYLSYTNIIDIKEYENKYKYKVTKGDFIKYVIYQKDIAEILGCVRATITKKLSKSSSFEYNGYTISKI